jgi:hypothetical protein
MTASKKIEDLRNLWLGYALFAAIADLVHSGFHGDALKEAVIGFLVMCGIAWFFASKLQAKSSVVWAFWVVGAILGIAINGLNILSLFADGGHFELLPFARGVIAIYFHIVTFRTLRDPDVKLFVMT